MFRLPNHNRRRLGKVSSAGLALLLLVLPVIAAIEPSAADLESDNVKRVGSRLACQCGSCKSTIACEMPGGCGYCKRVKTRIAQLQADGKSDQDVIDQLVKESGESYLAPPGAFGWLTPYLAALFGLGVIYWFVRRSTRAHAVAQGPAVGSEVFNRYHDKIEKDMEKLE
jgi:cytochrome c-type biogenesis protein CcmH/NrfF